MGNLLLTLFRGYNLHCRPLCSLYNRLWLHANPSLCPRTGILLRSALRPPTGPVCWPADKFLLRLKVWLLGLCWLLLGFRLLSSVSWDLPRPLLFLWRSGLRLPWNCLVENCFGFVQYLEFFARCSQAVCDHSWQNSTGHWEQAHTSEFVGVIDVPFFVQRHYLDFL